MPKPLQDLRAGDGPVLPSPVVTPTTSPGQGVAASDTRTIEADKFRLQLAESATADDRRSVEWRRASDGNLVADIAGFLDNPATSSGLTSTVYGPNDSTADLGNLIQVANPTDGGVAFIGPGQASGIYYANVRAYGTGAATNYSALILDETGGSDFHWTYARLPARATVTANTDTSLLGGGPTLHGGFLGPDIYGNYGGVHVVMGGDYLNNTAGTKTLTFKIVYGATTLWADTTVAFAASATRHAWNLEFWLANENATNAQVCWGTLGVSNATAATSGLGDLTGVPDLSAAPLAGTAAEDSTADKTLNVTVAHSVAGGATLDIRRYGGAFVERF